MTGGENVDPDIPLNRASSEYRAALEIELWKDITQQEFFANLSRKEERIFSELSGVFKEEQVRIESEVRTCKRSYDDLLKQYKNKLSSLEKRETKYTNNEASFERTHSLFSKERTAKLDDIKQKSNYKSDFLSIELETVNSKIRTAEHLNSRHAHRIEETEKTASLKEMELSATCQPDHYQIPVNLQEELFTAKTELANSKDKLSKTTIAKERYKMKLKSVLEELSKCKQATNQQQFQINSLPPLTVQPKYTKNADLVKTKHGNSDLDGIKSELENIITSMSSSTQKTLSIPSSQVESEIAKLISERNTLLNTGVYMSNDFIIQQLDKQIKSLLPLKEKSVY
ncbi:centrosomal protein of 120 kDa-like [Bolinopsis microptera]|uniref:centrosomal protein of 120 kDa-like n=1 Tax=Bolinopsis microptera TaxID=2820187 RepID=UPI00307AED76